MEQKLNTAVLTERNVVIQTDIIESDVPLLFSRDSIKRARVKLGLEKDKVVKVKELALNLAKADHNCVPIERTDMYSQLHVHHEYSLDSTAPYPTYMYH